jgi:hypothetical protein
MHLNALWEPQGCAIVHCTKTWMDDEVDYEYTNANSLAGTTKQKCALLDKAKQFVNDYIRDEQVDKIKSEYENKMKPLRRELFNCTKQIEREQKQSPANAAKINNLQTQISDIQLRIEQAEKKCTDQCNLYQRTNQHTKYFEQDQYWKARKKCSVSRSRFAQTEALFADLLNEHSDDEINLNMINKVTNIVKANMKMHTTK